MHPTRPLLHSRSAYNVGTSNAGHMAVERHKHGRKSVFLVEAAAIRYRPASPKSRNSRRVNNVTKFGDSLAATPLLAGRTRICKSGHVSRDFQECLFAVPSREYDLAHGHNSISPWVPFGCKAFRTVGASKQDP